MTVEDEARHVDYEMYQLLRLGAEMVTLDTRYDEWVREAMRVAYAAHFRAFVEFVHSGRPPQGNNHRDIKLNHFHPESIPEWTDSEIERLTQADQLMAHLSARRVELARMEREWGGLDDRELIEKHIQTVMETVPFSEKLFERTAKLRNGTK